MIIDLFAGAGGWEEGLRQAGYSGASLGIENWIDACNTATRAGHARLCADVREVELEQFENVEGILGSPPCPDFSTQGTNAKFGSERGLLTREPYRWIDRLRPKWVALEQVPGVLGYWRTLARDLANLGYHSWSGQIYADNYNVPQERTRAILMAHRDHQFIIPEATHITKLEDVFDMPEGTLIVSNNSGSGRSEKGSRLKGRRTLDQGCFTLTGRCLQFKWLFPDGNSRQLTIEECSVIQGFRSDYPWWGGRYSIQQQIGNAVPPPMAKAIIENLL